MNEANKRRESIKLANRIEGSDVGTVIVTGGIGCVCLDTLEETLSSAQGKEVTVMTLTDMAD